MGRDWGEPGVCWLFQGARDPEGYGRISYQRRSAKAHRVSWVLHRGEIPDGAMVLHRCDTPACVNPEHLELGTNSENMQQMYDRGRGNHSPRTPGKLSMEQVQEIRESPDPVPALAKRFSVTRTTIYNIRSGKTHRITSSG